jgi:hypothetical protein
MGILLAFPFPVRHVDAPEMGAPSDPPRIREELKAVLRFVPRGLSPMPARQPFVGELTTITSPDNADVKFDIKRCGNREHLARQDLASTMRYTQKGDDVITERDYPTGTMKLDTVLLALAGWNLTDLEGVALKITRDTVRDYLSPSEFDYLYDQILEVNPMWKPNGEEDTKNA